MKRILSLTLAALVACVFVQTAGAGPLQTATYRASTIAHKAAYRINKHIVRPAHRVVVNNTPR
jgi:hypothetical protein